MRPVATAISGGLWQSDDLCQNGLGNYEQWNNCGEE